MSDPPEQPAETSGNELQQNLHGFLHPGQSAGTSPALQLRMAQMELANRMRLQGSSNPGTVPIARKGPAGGFGSAQGILHLKRGDFGKIIPPPSISPLDRNVSTSPGAGHPDGVADAPASPEAGQPDGGVDAPASPAGPRRPRSPGGGFPRSGAARLAAQVDAPSSDPPTPASPSGSGSPGKSKPGPKPPKRPRKKFRNPEL